MPNLMERVEGGRSFERNTDRNGDFDALLAELETDSPIVALSRIRQLKVGGSSRPTTPNASLAGLQAVAGKVAALNGTIASMEEQLASLYSDRERLEHEIGASEVDDVIAAFGNLKAIIASMEEQLSCMYQDREVLDTALGRSDPHEIVEMFRNVSRFLNGAREQLESA